MACKIVNILGDSSIILIISYSNSPEKYTILPQIDVSNRL